MTMMIKGWMKLRSIPLSAYKLNTTLSLSLSSCIITRKPKDERKTIRLVKWDGEVITYDKAIKVYEILSEFPKQTLSICPSDAFYIGQKLHSLEETQQLRLGHNYFLLPTRLFEKPLTLIATASFLSNFNSASSSCRPNFQVQKSPDTGGRLRIHVSDQFISQLIANQNKLDNSSSSDEDSGSGSGSRVCNSAVLRKDYMRLVRSQSHRWKPKLETIKEKRKKTSMGSRSKNSLVTSFSI